MEHIIIKISQDGKQAHLVPEEGYLLKCQGDSVLHSDALIPNKAKELKKWSAVAA